MKDTQVGSRQLHHYLKPGSSKQKVAVAAIFEGWEEGGKREKAAILQICFSRKNLRVPNIPVDYLTTYLAVDLF